MLHSDAADKKTPTQTHSASDSDVLDQGGPPPPSLFAGLGGIDVVSELMEHGEHSLAVNRRRWRRDQGALEAPLGGLLFVIEGSNVLDLRCSPWSGCAASQRPFVGVFFLGGA